MADWLADIVCWHGPLKGGAPAGLCDGMDGSLECVTASISHGMVWRHYSLNYAHFMAHALNHATPWLPEGCAGMAPDAVGRHGSLKYVTTWPT